MTIVSEITPLTVNNEGVLLPGDKAVIVDKGLEVLHFLSRQDEEQGRVLQLGGKARGWQAVF